MKVWHHVILWVLIGYALGFWMPGIGNATLAKLYPRG